MWLLVSVKNLEEKLVFLAGEKYCVGRLEGDIKIPDDKSISRKHAYLQMQHPESNFGHPHKPPTLQVEDVSKFGTVINKEKITAGMAIVKSGDIVKFGTVDSQYRAVYKPETVTMSCLDPAAKKMTKAVMGRLGGHVVSDWRKDQCHMLIMTNLSVTVKVICALISQCPIVTPQYLEDRVAAIKNKTPEPDPKDYLPPLAESQLNPAEVSFRENEQRATLFQDKTFIFLSTKQFKKLNVAVDLAGGKPILIEEGTEDNDDNFLIKDNTCVMQCDPSDSTQSHSQNALDFIHHVINVLRDHNKRLIPDSEVGYAVLYCSTDRFCNPDIGNDHSQPGRHITTQSLEPQPPAPCEDVPETEVSLNRSRRSIGPGDVTTIPETEVSMNRSRRSMDADIGGGLKEEPVSQDTRENTAQETNNNKVKSVSKKRGRVDDSEETELSMPKAARTARNTHSFHSQDSTPDIKDEPLTPQMSPKRSRATRSPSPSSSNIKVEDSPSPPRRRGRRGRREEDSDGDTAIKDDPDDPFGGFDVPSTRRSRKASGKSRSPSPGPATRSSPRASRQQSRSPSPAPTKSSARGRRNKSKSPVPSDKSKSPASRSPSPRPGRGRRGHRQQSRSPSPVPEPSSPVTGRGGSPMLTESVPKEEPAESPPPSPSQGGWRRKKHRVPKLEPSTSGSFVVQNGEAADSELSASQVDWGRRVTDTKPELTQIKKMACPTPDDYLNKDRHHRVAASDVPPLEKDEEKGKTTVEERSLVVSKPKPKQVSNRNAGDTCMWNGKPCKNFKKFRKNQHAGANGLPRIIGGTDLTVASRHRSKEMEDWFREMAEEEHQRDEVDKTANEMFDYEPKGTKKRRK